MKDIRYVGYFPTIELSKVLAMPYVQDQQRHLRPEQMYDENGQQTLKAWDESA